MRVTLNVEIDMLLCCFEIYALYVDHMNVELHSYLVIYQSTCYFQLLFGCHYSIGSSVEYQGSVLFQQYTFITVFVALAPQQN